MEGEAWLPNFLCIAFQGVVIGAAGCAQVGGIEGAVGIERFGKAQGDGRVFFAVRNQAHPAYHILAHVENPARLEHFGHRGDLHRADALLAFDERAVGGHEGRRLVGKDFDRPPVGGGVAELVPTRQLAAGIVALAHEHVRLQNGTLGYFPLGAGGDDFAAAVCIRDDDLRQELWTVGVVLAAQPGDVANAPTIAENGAEGVRPRTEEAGYIIYLVLDVLEIMGPTGGEEVVADFGSVQASLVQADGGGIQAGRGNRLGKVELGAQEGRGAGGARPAPEGRADPLSVPISSIQQPHLPPGGFAFGYFSHFIPHTHLPKNTLG